MDYSRSMAGQDAGERLRDKIRAGTIGSLEELKAEFKAAAKRTHPDLGGTSTAEEFLRLRKDYEAALRDLSAGAGGRREEDPFTAFRGLLKRGFPKKPRHEKERLRYTMARLRCRTAFASWDAAAGALFDALEEELLVLKDGDPRGFDIARRLLSDIVAARLDGTEERIAAVRMELSRRTPRTVLGGGGSDARMEWTLGPGTAAFLRFLAYLENGRGEGP